MSFWILGLVAGLLLSIACGAGAVKEIRGATVTDASQRMRAVAIYQSCPLPEQRGMGSGLFIGPNRVLTAAHVVSCLAPGAVFYVRDNFGLVREAKLEWLSLETDTAVLAVSGPPMEVEPLKVGRVQRGETVCIVAEIPTPDRQCGVVLGTKSEGVGNVRHTAKTIAGNSGSGVYDADGRIVGIVTHKTPGGGLFSSLYGRKIL